MDSATARLAARLNREQAQQMQQRRDGDSDDDDEPRRRKKPGWQRPRAFSDAPTHPPSFFRARLEAQAAIKERRDSTLQRLSSPNYEREVNMSVRRAAARAESVKANRASSKAAALLAPFSMPPSEVPSARMGRRATWPLDADDARIEELRAADDSFVDQAETCDSFSKRVAEARDSFSKRVGDAARSLKNGFRGKGRRGTASPTSVLSAAADDGGRTSVRFVDAMPSSAAVLSPPARRPPSLDELLAA